MTETITENLEPHQRIVRIINELRKSLLSLGLAIIFGTVGFYFLSPILLQGLQKHLNQKLAFFAVAEPFISLAKFSLAVTLFCLMPWILYTFWRALAGPFKLTTTSRNWFVIFTCFLFYTGSSFCYFFTLPFGINFLLGFQSEQLQAVISIGKFVTFVTMFILAFGVIFELPIFMIFSAMVGICPRQTFEKNRRYAVLIISIVSALLTPTPDVVNMLLMGGPLYLLYELGIIILRILKV